MKARLSIAVLFAVLAVTAFGNMGHGAEPQYPTRQIEIVVPAGPGGGTDVVTRAIAPLVSKRLGQTILVVNKTGGGTVVGTHYGLKQSKPDGYTVFADTHGASSMMVAGMNNPPAKLEDRIFISRMVADPICFSVKADAPWKTFREFTEWVKTHTKDLSFGSGGPAGISAYTVNDWLSKMGLNPADARLVIADSGTDSLTKVAGGHITLACQTVAESFTLAQAGKVRVLAVASDNRSAYMPEVPTMAEMGSPTAQVIWWMGISAPRGTPPYAVDRWAKALEDVSKDPGFLKQLQNLHNTVAYLGPAEFKDFVYKETENYTQLATKLGIRQ
jgi:tripartite-type tricarboxylate transporter receptor subunit TctC